MNVRRRLEERVPPGPWHLAALAVATLAFPGTALSDEIPRTSWGAPDLQGTWDFRSITPFERPKEFGDKEFLSAEEIAAWEARTLKAREDRRNRDPVLGQGDVDVGYKRLLARPRRKDDRHPPDVSHRGSSGRPGAGAYGDCQAALCRAVRPLGRSACRTRGPKPA